MKKILLYSGGMDSWLIDKLWKPDHRLHISYESYSTPPTDPWMSKYTSVEEMWMYYNKDNTSPVDKVTFPLQKYEREDKIVPLRNLYFVMVACNEYPDDDLEIMLGATGGDRVLDKSPEFAYDTSRLLSYLYSPQWWTKGRKIRVCLDYKDKTKQEILQEYLDKGGNINDAFNKSFSCYSPVLSEYGKVWKERQSKTLGLLPASEPIFGPCWKCKPCFRKFVAFEACGYKFSDKVLHRVIPYIAKEIMPQINKGTYGRGEKEEALIKSIVEKYQEYA